MPRCKRMKRPHASVRAGCCVTVWRHMGHVRSSVKQKAKFSFNGGGGETLLWENSHKATTTAMDGDHPKKKNWRLSSMYFVLYSALHV